MKTNTLISKIVNHFFKDIFFKIITISLCILFLRNDAFSQESRKDKIEAMKISFITQKLDLTTKEAQLFWPIYNEYQDKLQAIRKSKRKEAKAIRNDIDDLPDAEVEAMIDAEIQSKQQEASLAKEYHAKFKQILSVKKVAKLYRAEEDFKRELLNQIKTTNK